MRSRILIVDDDKWLASMIGTMLRHGGHTVETATDGEDALAKARTFDPDLIITDVVMERMDGFAFVQQLRSQESTVLVPVIFLTALADEEARIRGFQLGADDYLAKPFRFEELNLRVERTLRHVHRLRTLATQIASDDARSVALNGSISQIGVGSLLTILEMDRKSGVLVLTSAEGSGRVFLRNGRVIAATLANDHACVDADAVYVMLGWSDGTFELTAIDVDMDDRIELPTMELLLEGARRLDESRHHASAPEAVTPPPDAEAPAFELAQLLDEAAPAGADETSPLGRTADRVPEMNRTVRERERDGSPGQDDELDTPDAELRR